MLLSYYSPVPYLHWSDSDTQFNFRMENMARLVLCMVLLCSDIRHIAGKGSTEDFPIVKTTEGELQGTTSVSRSGRPYHSFVGIPYAQPPERFQPPKPALPWSGVRNASEGGEMCIQDVWMFDYVQTVAGSEDCLFLYLQTPDSKSTKLFPVVVFFHGGGFNFGSGNAYEGTYLLDHDVVFVTVNYRLGAFGFLDTEDGVVGGNMGMKDQVMALKWIQKNIASFGGDPKKVTIMGHSAGGASAFYHMLSPMSKGLFHQIISLSGSPLNPWASMPKPKYMAERLGAKLNCPTGCTKELVDCLKIRDAREFSEHHFRRWNLDTAIPFGPTKESTSGDKEIFLNQDPLKLLQEGKFKNVPVLMGITQDEGLLYHGAIVLQSEKSTKDLDENWNKIAPITLLYDKDEHKHTEAEQNEWSRKIRKFYFGDKPVGMDTGRELINCYSDRWFNHGVRSTAILVANQSTKESPVFTYILNYRGEDPVLSHITGAKDTSGIFSTATHADELALLFKTPYFPQPLTERTEKFSKKMVKIWADFIIKGQLIGDDGKELNPLSPNEEPVWHELSENPIEVIKEPFTKRMKFWDGILNYEIKTGVGKTEL